VLEGGPDRPAAVAELVRARLEGLGKALSRHVHHRPVVEHGAVRVAQHDRRSPVLDEHPFGADAVVVEQRQEDAPVHLQAEGDEVAL
jgi:hypothetical protein